MRNPYKRSDVFACNYRSHARFENKVSAYHVLRIKKCYPQGCLQFRWFCSLKNKGKTCIRGFNHVGRLCDGCSHYRDEKQHFQPKIKISKEEYKAFLEEIEDFEDWLLTIRNRTLECAFKIDSVKPKFQKEITPGRSQIRLDGYLLIMKNGFIGIESLDDLFYAIVSSQQQDRFVFAPGDEIEAKTNVKLDLGRILLTKLWHIDFIFRSGAETWTNGRALVSRESAKHLAHQPDSCLHCEKGMLVDITERNRANVQNRRELYCLAGIQDPSLCYINSLKKLDTCPTELGY